MQPIEPLPLCNKYTYGSEKIAIWMPMTEGHVVMLTPLSTPLNMTAEEEGQTVCDYRQLPTNRAMESRRVSRVFQSLSFKFSWHPSGLFVAHQCSAAQRLKIVTVKSNGSQTTAKSWAPQVAVGSCRMFGKNLLPIPWTAAIFKQCAVPPTVIGGAMEVWGKDHLEIRPMGCEFPISSIVSLINCPKTDGEP